MVLSVALAHASGCGYVAVHVYDWPPKLPVEQLADITAPSFTIQEVDGRSTSAVRVVVKPGRHTLQLHYRSGIYATVGSGRKTGYVIEAQLSASVQGGKRYKIKRDYDVSGGVCMVDLSTRQVVARTTGTVEEIELSPGLFGY